MDISFEYTNGKRVDSLLVYTTDDKYLFKIKRTDQHGIKHYVCYYNKGSNRCSSKITIQGDICRRVKKFEAHSHDNQEAEYKLFLNETKIKLRCQSDKKTAIQKIYQEQKTASEHSLPPFRKLRSAMLFHKSKELPLNPTSVENITTYFIDKNVQGLLKTESGSNFYQVKKSTEIYTFVIFASEHILNDLPESRQFNISATMRVVPPGFFKVMLTFSVIKLDKVSVYIFFIGFLAFSISFQRSYRHFRVCSYCRLTVPRRFSMIFYNMSTKDGN